METMDMQEGTDYAIRKAPYGVFLYEILPYAVTMRLKLTNEVVVLMRVVQEGCFAYRTSQPLPRYTWPFWSVTA